jgi:transposase-like protein
MPLSVLNHPELQSEAAAYEFVEAKLWPNGPECPHCGTVGRAYALKNKSARIGLKKCAACRKTFTVKVGTIFEDSHVPMHKWLQALHLLCSSKKGMSSHQLHRILGVTLKTAWFLSHRIREAMRDGSLGPLGGAAMTVEADETFVGRKQGVPVPKGGYSHKHIVLALVERGGKVRSVHINELTKAVAGRVVRENIARESRLMTDEARHYRGVGKDFAGHGTIHHTLGEYVNRDDPTIHTNTVEGAFSIFKRGMRGIYQHCREQHLHRYLAEFDFRYNNRVALGVNDARRAENALRGAVGRRLLYRDSCGWQRSL